MLTTSRWLVLVALVFLVWAPAAHAWSWPVQGSVLQPFSYNEAHPYAAGQHRGIDIGAGAAGGRVVAPAVGTVSFAGSVPTSGESVTIETPDGYSVTLTHLGSIAVSKGATVAEGDAVGTIGPSGTPEVEGPYVHLGIRETSDPNGYLDPLRFLPPPSASAPAQSTSPVSQPSASSGTVTTPATQAAAPASSEPPASASAPSATTRGAKVRPARSSGRSRRVRGLRDRLRSSASVLHEMRRPHSSQRAVLHSESAGTRAQLPVTTPQHRIDVQTGSSRRPVVEAAADAARLRLDAGHELQRRRGPTEGPKPERPSVLLPLACNGAAALIALAAAFAASRTSRRRRAGRGAAAQVLHLPRPVAGLGRERRAA
jgi:pyruvate/2-oxoglutarate dehydrogenase complex dihydrolipoamide acyltransferase (E2) component